MKQEKEKSFDEALKSSGRLLSRRQHTVSELRGKLARREFPKDVIDEVVAVLAERKFLDDANFAESYFNELTAKGLGLTRIRLAMRKRGVPPEISGEVMGRGFSEDDEAGRAADALKKRRLFFEREKDLNKRKQKMFRYLVSRGFSSAVICKAVAGG
ncbi:MAG: regulatory protein RecX [Victivallales bacterium]|jgi:regulatory protein